MDQADLLRRLQGYGLDEGEASLYFHLSRLGPSRAADVARAASHIRTDAYRLLDRLVEKGFAQKSLERPARYIPEPIEAALGRALAHRQAETATLETGRDLLTTAWPQPVAESAPTRQRFSVHQGKAQVMGALLRMVAAAREEVLIATSPDGLARIDAAALRTGLLARAAAGVSVRVLSRRGKAAAALAGPGVKLRLGDLPTFYQAVIVDSREIALFVSSGKGISGAEETVLALNSSDVVVAQKALFDLAWAKGVAEADPARSASFPHVHVLRGRWVRTSHLKDMILRARQSLSITVPADEAAAWGGSGVLQALQSRATQGIAVTIQSKGPLVVPGIQVTSAPDATALVAVMDGAEALVGLRTTQGESDEDAWALSSTHPDFVSLLAAGAPAGARIAEAVRRRPTNDL